MTLFRDLPHADRSAAFSLAAERVGLPDPAFAEKDYWAMQVLASLVTPFTPSGGGPSPQVVFKGGTSLSKGFGLIHRFSEDIDVFLIVDGPLSKRAPKEQYMRPMTRRAYEALGQEPEKDLSLLGGGNGGSSDSHYNSDFWYGPRDTAGTKPRVLLELSVKDPRSAHPEPVTITLDTFVAQALGAESAEFDDLAPFEAFVLPPVRTLIEKLCAIIGIYDDWRGGNPGPLLRGARHFYDVAALLGSEEVIADLVGTDVGYTCELVRAVTDANEYSTGSRPDGGLAASGAFWDGAWLASAQEAYLASVPPMAFNRPPDFMECVEVVRASAHLL